MPSNQVIIRPKLVPYQKRILESDARFTVTTAATKIGKTFSHSWWLFDESCRPPKSGANYWWVAPVFSQAEIAFNRMRRFLGQSSDYRVNLSKMYIGSPPLEPNGFESFLHYKSAENPDTLYGEDVYAAVFDEFTRAKEDAWFALRSTLTATNGKCKFIGNAKGRKNWGYKLSIRAKGGEPGYEYFKITAYDAIKEGILTLEEVEQAKRDLPKYAFDELYLAESQEDGANPFGYSFIEKQIRPISNAETVCFGIDLAKSVDWTVVTGLDKQGNVSFFERWQSDWAQTKKRIISIVGQKQAFIDSTGVGDPIAEDIKKECRRVENYQFTSQSKQKIMEGLASGIQSGSVTILDGVMRDELESFEFEYTRTGVRYSAPSGMHDDCVCSLALAFHKLQEYHPTNVYVSFH